MSAHAQSRPAGATTTRRNPFSDAVNHLHQAGQEMQTKKVQQPLQVTEKAAQPSSPPLPRQNAKIQPPSPPSVITDKTRALHFQRVGFLGEVCDSCIVSSPHVAHV